MAEIGLRWVCIMSEKKVIGFYMRQNKRDRFNWDSGFIPAAEKRGYSVVPCDGTDENQKLDVIIAKLTDEFGSFHEESCQQVIARFQVSINRLRTFHGSLIFSKRN